MTRTLLLLGFCSLILAQSPASSSTDWRFAQPNADVRISIDLQALLKSDLVAEALAQAERQPKADAAQINLALGILRTVDRISVSAHQNAPNDTDVLAQVTGSFDLKTIAGLFPSTGNSKVQMVGAHTILIGEGDSFAQALARMTADLPAPSGALQKDELEQSDVWIQAGPALLARPGRPVPPMLQGLRRLSMGLMLSQAPGGLPEINLVLSAADDAAAGQMLTTLQTMMGPVLLALPAGAEAAKALSLKQDGSKVRVRFVVSPELMAMAQQQAAAASMGGGFVSLLAPLLGTAGPGGSVQPPSSAATPAAPPNGGKVMIYGLDGGPQESPAPQ